MVNIKLEENKKDQLKKAFDKFDDDQDGQISYNDAKELILNEEEELKIFDNFDRQVINTLIINQIEIIQSIDDTNDKITLDDLIYYIFKGMHQYGSKEIIEKGLHQLVETKKGNVSYVNIPSLRKFLKGIGKKMSEDEINEIIIELSEDEQSNQVNLFTLSDWITKNWIPNL